MVMVTSAPVRGGSFCKVSVVIGVPFGWALPTHGVNYIQILANKHISVNQILHFFALHIGCDGLSCCYERRHIPLEMNAQTRKTMTLTLTEAQRTPWNDLPTRKT